MILLDTLPGREALDEGARPKAPRMPEATDAHRAHGRQLGMIHGAHRRELTQLRAIVERIETGASAAGDLVKAVEDMGMARNLKLFGALCGRECQHLQFHHDIEEQHTFVVLEKRGSKGLRAVVAKLRKEHEIVHALIHALAERASLLMREPSANALEGVREAIDRLEEVVHSHFGYEERELEEALGVHEAL